MAVTLTGVGERRHLASATVNLDTHIDDVCAVIEHDQLDRVVHAPTVTAAWW